MIPAAQAKEPKSEGETQRRLRVRPFPFSELPRILKVQLELSRILFDHLAAVLDALSGSDGPAQLVAACAGRLEVSCQSPYLFAADEAQLRLRGGRCFCLELIAPAQHRFVLCVDESLIGRLDRSDQELLSLLRRALSAAPLRVIDALPLSDAAALISKQEQMILGMDALLDTGSGSGWLRLCTSSDLRLAAPPPLGPRALASLWQRRDLLAEVKVALRINVGQILPGGK